jgi:hypothetical protein
MNDLLLVGSAPLDTAEDVFTTFGSALGPHLAAIPDGEVFDRRYWVVRLSFQVFNGHPDLETIRRPQPDENGVERLIPSGIADYWQFKIRDGVDEVRFGAPGERLGYAKDAINSYFVFKTLKQRGVLPKGLRFQVSLPMTNSAVTPMVFPFPGDVDKVRCGYEAALLAEIDRIVAAIPHDELAIQWDCSFEITDVYGAIPGLPAEGRLERNVRAFRNLSPHVPNDVQLGIHLCFGTFGGWPRLRVDDLGAAVDLANAAIAAAGRPIDWVHIPALPTADDAFYAPLARLDPQGARVYLGLIHNMETFPERLATARKYLPDFGIGAYCDFGRMAPSDMPRVLQEHRDALELALAD